MKEIEAKQKELESRPSFLAAAAAATAAAMGGGTSSVKGSKKGSAKGSMKGSANAKGSIKGSAKGSMKGSKLGSGDFQTWIFFTINVYRICFKLSKQNCRSISIYIMLDIDILTLFSPACSYYCDSISTSN